MTAEHEESQATPASPPGDGTASPEGEQSLLAPVLQADAVDASPFQSLDPRSVQLARIGSLISFSILGVIALAVGIPMILFADFPAQLVVPLAWLALIPLALIRVIWWPAWDYQRWSYRISDQVVELRFGVVWRSAISIPLSRLQHVDIHRGPIQRRFELASLELHTAGTHNASHTIAGIEVGVATRVRDQLIDATNRRIAKANMNRGEHAVDR